MSSSLYRGVSQLCATRVASWGGVAEQRVGRLLCRGSVANNPSLEWRQCVEFNLKWTLSRRGCFQGTEHFTTLAFGWA